MLMGKENGLEKIIYGGVNKPVLERVPLNASRMLVAVMEVLVWKLNPGRRFIFMG